MTPKPGAAALLAAILAAAALPAAAAEEATIKDLIVTGATSPTERAGVERAVRAFYAFWNTGDEALLREALAPGFTDHTLPPGRPQGPEGPAFASRSFRRTVPDLHVTIEKMVIAGEYVTVHMHFTGHFTGEFGTTRGGGQPIDFIATDLVRVTAGRISDNWHIEDNLTLLWQMGLMPRAP